MEWTTAVDGYCERVDASFWAEPLNAVTNISFIIAAFLCWRMARAAGRFHGLSAALIVLLTCIGIGSFLFHTFAQRWAGLADTLPILIFILTYIWSATRFYLGQTIWVAWLSILGAIGFAAAFLYAWTVLIPGVQASQGYLPVLVIIVMYGLVLARRGHPAATGLFAGAAVFSLSLTFRSLDQPLCGILPMGTHFMWHILNGVLLGIVTATFIRHGRRDVAAGAAGG